MQNIYTGSGETSNPESAISKSEFEQFVRVQESGEYNMMSPEARMQTTLGKSEWLNIIRNYDKYKEMFDNQTLCCDGECKWLKEK